jgi:peptide/nickel transport system substrate-binding protein
VAALAVAALLALTGCTGSGTPGTGSSAVTPQDGPTVPTSSSGPGTDSTITVGTTDQLAVFDPAGAELSAAGSLLVDDNIYQFLLRVPPGGGAPVPDAAQSCAFTAPTVYTCQLRPGLRFANGDPLTAEDVAYSLRRVRRIGTVDGAATLLGNLISIATPDPSTVAFTLRTADDQTWPLVLTTIAGAIVDDQVFPSDAVQPDDQVVGSGPYRIASVSAKSVTLTAASDYVGADQPQTPTILLRHYAQSHQLRVNLQSGALDVVWNGLSPTAVHTLLQARGVRVLTGAGSELRLLGFNLRTMPGATAAQQLAIRQAIAYSLDRQALARQVYRSTYQPAYSLVPNGIAGATTPFLDSYGTAPDRISATRTLTAAGVHGRVALVIAYTPQLFGPQTGQEYAALKAQLQATGLFRVRLHRVGAAAYASGVGAGTFPIFQYDWVPPYADADGYLAPLLGPDSPAYTGYCTGTSVLRPCDTDGVLALLTAEQTEPDPGRTTTLSEVQQLAATGALPYVPLLSADAVAAINDDVNGMPQTLDPTGQLRAWLLSKSS